MAPCVTEKMRPTLVNQAENRMSDVRKCKMVSKMSETLKDGGLGLGNVWIAKDLMEAIEKDRTPRASGYDGRAALEMVLAVYESYRLQRPVDLPLKNRKHPLTML